MNDPVRRQPIDLPGGGGLHLAADRWGAPDDPPVILLHGAGQSRRAWDDTAAAIAKAGWQAIAIDHRGHGDSEWPVEADYDWDHFADDVDAIIDHVGQPPVLVGASLGGLAALIAQARCHHSLYRALILVDVTPRMELQGIQRIVGFMSAHPDGFASLDEASEVIAAYTGRPKPPDSAGLRQVLRPTDDGRWTWHWDIRFLTGRAEMILDADPQVMADHPMRQMLHDGVARIGVPTLVVRGAMSDLVTPEAAREFVEAVPGSRYVDVADAGHMVAGDQNDRFTAAIIEFLRDLRLPTT